MRLICFALIGCTLFNWVSCVGELWNLKCSEPPTIVGDGRRQLLIVGESVHNDATQLDVELCRYKRGLIVQCQLTCNIKPALMDIVITQLSLRDWTSRLYSIISNTRSFELVCNFRDFVRAHAVCIYAIKLSFNRYLFLCGINNYYTQLINYLLFVNISRLIALIFALLHFTVT